MEVTKDDLADLLLRYNPWWKGEAMAGLPKLRRAAFGEFYSRLRAPPGDRAVAVVGMRRVGKTTLLLQAIADLIAQGNAAPGGILYVSFDHPLLMSVSADEVLGVWQELVPRVEGGMEYLFLDEIQELSNWGAWVKHQVDFQPHRRIVFTGSVMPLTKTGQESGVGRWQELWVPTLSFSEYLQLAGVELPSIPEVTDLGSLFDWPEAEFLTVANAISPHAAHFHEYLMRGGFPWAAEIEDLVRLQSLLREDMQKRVLGMDIPSEFEIRLIKKMVQLFLYLCLHEGSLINMSSLCSNLGIARPTLSNYLEILEQAHLIYTLAPHGLGKEVLRGRHKVYLAGAGLAAAMLLKRSLSAEELGEAVEAAVFRHLLSHCRAQEERLFYWRRGKLEVDFVLERGGHPLSSLGQTTRDQGFLELQAASDGERLLPIEVKYRSQGADPRALKGLAAFCIQQGVGQAYVVTRALEDFGPMALSPRGRQNDPISVMRIPAFLFCYWLGQAEQRWRNRFAQA